MHYPFDFFPAIEPYASGHLAVDAPHEIYWERCGNPQGYPILFLHGGPGWACSDMHRRFFDPVHYNVHLFDQRGAGRSRPLGEIRHNSTADLIADIERLRVMWGIEKWHVFGGSWGSTLALAYAQTHPERVSALILRGIFLLRKADIVWFLTQAGQIWPEHERSLLAPLTVDERSDIIGSYYKRLTNPDPAIHMPAAMAWVKYEIGTSSLLPPNTRLDQVEPTALTHSMALMEAHYFHNNLFTPDDKLLRDVDRIRHIPATIVQGRYDLVCPLRSADDLHQAWPEAHYVVIPDAGHSAMEPGIRSALIEATEKYKQMR